MLGFCEIDGTVYINEFADCAFPDDGNVSKDALRDGFAYHPPCFTMLSFVCRDSDRWEAYEDRQYELVGKDWHVGERKDFDEKDKDSENDLRYLQAVSFALNMPPFDSYYHGDERRKMRDLVRTKRAWLNTYLELGGSDGMSSEK